MADFSYLDGNSDRDSGSRGYRGIVVRRQRQQEVAVLVLEVGAVSHAIAVPLQGDATTVVAGELILTRRLPSLSSRGMPLVKRDPNKM